MSFQSNKFTPISSKDPQRSFEIDFSNFLRISEKYVLTGSKYKALRHSECTTKIEAFIKENKTHGFNLDKMKFPFSQDIFYNQLRIFVLKLKVFCIFQEKYKLKSKENLGDILLGCLREGFNFNSNYKKRLDAYTRSFLKGETDLVYQDFPASHLLPWLDEEPIDKIYVFSEPLPVKEYKIQRVKNMMNMNILDNAFIRDIDVIDAFYLINNKKMNHLDDKGRTKTSFECRNEDCDTSFPNGELDYLFKKVTTDPATSRMAGLPTVQTRNVGYAAHTNLDKVTMCPNDLYKEGLDEQLWKYKLTSEEDRWFILIDFKKSGLTTNRRVIEAVYETALEHYPGFRPWAAYLDCLKNIRVNGMYSKRGTSLGMDDNAISFFLGNAFQGWLERHEHYKKNVQGYFKGDDQVIICNMTLEETKVLFREWIKELKHLGFLVNAKKSFIGLRGQFCEIVGKGSGIDTKEIEFALNCFDALGTYNMVDFKIFLNSLKNARDNRYIYAYSEIFNFAMATVINSVEREFGIDDEIFAPFEMGGYFSSYEEHLNVFIINVEEKKLPPLDRRLYNLIGLDRPTQEFEYKRRKRIFNSLFSDTRNILEKIRKMTVEPMSPKWRNSYDKCLKLRQERFKGEIRLIGAGLQTLIDKRESYALPYSLLIEADPTERIPFVPKKKLRRGLKAQLKQQQRPRQMIEKIEKSYYLIDEIRAKELLVSAKTGNNIFNIKYYHTLPMSTIIWSLCKYVTNSKYGIPIRWAEFCFQTKTSLENIWKYYNRRGYNLYNFYPRIAETIEITSMFRGPERSDTIIICPYSGFPIKFHSDSYYNWKENRGKEKKFFLDISDYYFKEWQSDEMRSAWYGALGRNLPVEKKYYEEKFVPIENLLVGMEYVDTELFNFYQQLQNYLWLDSNVSFESLDSASQYWHTLAKVEFQEELKAAEEQLSKSYEELSEHDSGSDYLEEYFKDNPLNDDTDQEEDPYQNLSDSEEEEEN